MAEEKDKLCEAAGWKKVRGHFFYSGEPILGWGNGTGATIHIRTFCSDGAAKAMAVLRGRTPDEVRADFMRVRMGHASPIKYKPAVRVRAREERVARPTAPSTRVKERVGVLLMTHMTRYGYLERMMEAPNSELPDLEKGCSMPTLLARARAKDGEEEITTATLERAITHLCADTIDDIRRFTAMGVVYSDSRRFKLIRFGDFVMMAARELLMIRRGNKWVTSCMVPAVTHSTGGDGDDGPALLVVRDKVSDEDVVRAEPVEGGTRISIRDVFGKDERDDRGGVVLVEGLDLDQFASLFRSPSRG